MKENLGLYIRLAIALLLFIAAPISVMAFPLPAIDLWKLIVLGGTVGALFRLGKFGPVMATLLAYQCGRLYNAEVATRSAEAWPPWWQPLVLTGASALFVAFLPAAFVKLRERLLKKGY